MNILHMKYAVEVARLGSLNKAAETLMIAQPNISRSIKELEADLGITIFQRSAKGMVLTPDGEEFMESAREILNRIDKLEKSYHDGSHKKRKFSISVPRACYISAAMAEFSKSIGDAPTEIYYKETNSKKTIKKLLENEYRRAVDEAGRLDELAARREELSDSLRSAEEKYKTINLTREHLNAAKDSLTTKYLGKTRTAFREYISVMTGEAPELFNLSVDFGIAKSEGSVSKPQEAFSLGTREVYALAARLALADSLYDVDKPFIILDDPFVHLDDKRYAAAAKIIKKIASERQIIYLTCSKSRAIQAR